MDKQIKVLRKKIKDKSIKEMYLYLKEGGYANNDIKTIIKAITDEEIMLFDDLEFKPHQVVSRADPDAIHAHGELGKENYSVVQGNGLYGDKDTNTYEVYNSDMDEPDGWLTPDEVTITLLNLFD